MVNLIPLLITAALSAASMGANAAGQRKVDKARAAAMRESRERNDRLAQRADASSKSTTDLLIGTPGKEEEAARLRAETMKEGHEAKNPLTGQTSEDLLNSTRAPNESTHVVADRAMRKAKTDKFISQQEGARAKLSSFGDVMGANNIGVNRNAQDLNQLAGSMQNWNQRVLPMQLDAANAAGGNWKNLADVLQVVSMIYGGSGALTKGVTAGANAAANTTANAAAQTGTMATSQAALDYMNSGIPRSAATGAYIW